MDNSDREFKESENMLHPDLLKVFISVVENSSFTLAGSEMHRTQSAISMKIKRLEETIGAPVFERNGRTIQLTDEGRILLDYAKRILCLVDETMSAVGAKKRVNVVRLGCIEDYAVRLMPQILASFWLDHPDIHIDLKAGDSAHLLSRLGDDLDLVLAEFPVGMHQGHVVRTDSLVWCTSSTQAPHLKQPIPVAFRTQGPLERNWASMALDAAGRPWRLAYQTAGIGTLQSAVEAGLAVGVFKESMTTGNLRHLSDEDGFPRLPKVEITLHTAGMTTYQADTDKVARHLLTGLASPEALPCGLEEPQT